MNRKIAKTLSALLLVTAIAVTQVPASDVEAVAPSSDFEMDGTKLMKYSGTAEVVSVPDGVKIIGEEAFAGNDNLIKVMVGDDVESIGYRAFADCDNLRTITVGNGVEEIETAAFSNNKELVNVTLGDNVKKLGSGVFAGCSQLKELSVSEDNSYLFYSNGILYDDEQTKVYALMPAFEKGAYTLPGTVKEIAAYAFWGNPYLEKVTLGSGLNEVPAYAFSNCLNLKEVEIPLTVRGIGAKAFEDCVNLTKVTLPDSIAQISDSAFDGCPNVEFMATPGTYSAEFAAAFRTSDVEEVEYEDVQDAQTVDADSISNDKESNVPASNPTPKAEVTAVTEIVNNKTLLGESSIVSGRALIFIDNRQSTVLEGNAVSGRIDLTDMEETGVNGEENLNSDSESELENLLIDNAQKGKEFPKYTIVNDTAIASQAFYQDSSLVEYMIEDGITQIGEFAFARSGLTRVVIPEGVVRIGYGAFYHCDQLSEVTIPDSVTEIEPYAFDKTPWIKNMKTATYPFLIVGDGILIAYDGSDSVINIPNGVKQIGPGVFKDHMGITAVNIPDTVQVIGEEAFMNCKNLKTVNGARNLVSVKDRAFMNCPLSQVVIPNTMKEVGLGAYALSNGTDTVVFQGSELPQLSIGQGARRLANKEYRTYAFDNIRNAIVSDEVSDFAGTVLEQGTYGFSGIICNESGNMLADNGDGISQLDGTEVVLRINSKSISEGEHMMASIPGESDAYILKITDSDVAAEKILGAYGELYGGRTPSNLKAYEAVLYDGSGSVPINKLGKQYITVQMKIPEGIVPENLHIVTLDQDGQMEAVSHRVTELSDGNYIQFTTNHFSPIGIYNYTAVSGQATVTNGKSVILNLSGNKDNTPDTGDPLHPKWFLAVGLLAGSIALFFYKGKPKRNLNK